MRFFLYICSWQCVLDAWQPIKIGFKWQIRLILVENNLSFVMILNVKSALCQTGDQPRISFASYSLCPIAPFNPGTGNTGINAPVPSYWVWIRHCSIFDRSEETQLKCWNVLDKVQFQAFLWALMSFAWGWMMVLQHSLK